MSGLIAGIKIDRNIRYALLAGTMMLPVIAYPQASAAENADQASVGTIILAQAVDPATGKPLPKGVQPKAAPQPQPKGPPTAAPSGAPPAGAGGPPPGAPKVGAQPRFNQPVQAQQPTGQPPAGAGTPPHGLQPQQKLGIQPKGNQPLQSNVPPTGQPPAGQPPAGTATAPQGLQPQQKLGVQPSGQPPVGAAGTPSGTPSTQPRQFGAQPPNVPLQGKQNVVPGAQPLPNAATQNPPAQAGLPRAPAAVVVPQGAPNVIVRGNVDALRTQRQEHREPGGRIVIQEPGNRLIVRENGVAFVRHDETARFRVWGEPRLERRGAEQFAYVTRPGGYQIITVTDANGRMLRRMRRGPDGREVILINNGFGPGAIAAGVGVGLAAGVILGLAAPVITIPRERYIVDVSAAPAPLLYETLEAPPLVDIERPYSLDEIRYNVALRDRMRRIDIDSVTFDTGSWEVTPEQQPKLQVLADALQQILAQHPDEVFMIEGHTDAVGNDVDNLSLSDRRAESVAAILASAFQIPPENLVTQGYGEQHLKIPTDGPSRENRRTTVRRITPLLNGKVARL